MHTLDLLLARRAGERRPLFLIAGPCVIEDPSRGPDFTLGVARRLRDILDRRHIPWIFKSSFDKANRTSRDSFRGPGLDGGLAVMERIRRELGVPVLSDVHETAQVAAAAAVLDVLQIPAFLCRQTDLLVAAARHARALNIKKGQFLAPRDMQHALDKARGAGGTERVALTERGTTFGYGNLIVDMTAIPVLQSLGAPVVFDGTHSVQQPGGLGHASGGRREMIPTLVLAAVAAGCDGLFLEVHPDPDRALSDGPNMLAIEQLEALLGRVLAVREALE
ncbi:MAG: 3-deoxy-8-phosphooctulonate synthase [Planctomycetes bacterium]|nr:3-deoxy-8-phosphooctulonate synthase [Planctomycetota bacterium]